MVQPCRVHYMQNFQFQHEKGQRGCERESILLFHNTLSNISQENQVRLLLEITSPRRNIS